MVAEEVFGALPLDERIGYQATVEHLKILLVKERDLYPLCKDYLASTNADHGFINEKVDLVSESWRRKLCEWSFEVVDHFNFDREVVSFALDYLDRFVAFKTFEDFQGPMPKREFQLLAVTSLYTAIKVHGETDEKEGPRRKLRIAAFVELSRGFFSIETIEKMERELLEVLKWKVNPPTSLRFTSSLLRLCPKWTDEEHSTPYAHVMGGLLDVSRYLTELSVCVSIFSFTYKTSVMSFASILCAIEALQTPLPISTEKRDEFFRNVAAATGLTPDDPDVKHSFAKLKELCPSLYQEETTDGSVSPVCVVGMSNMQFQEQESPRSHLKRNRSANAADDQPSQHRPMPLAQRYNEI
jgi:hypothetical protein